MIRLVNYVSFQPRISIISGTLAATVPELFHFALVLAVIVPMYAVLSCIGLGYRCGRA